MATINVSISSLAIIAPRSASLPPNIGPPMMIAAGVFIRFTRAMPLRLLGIGQLDGVRRVDHHQREEGDPHRQPDAVAAQRQPQQVPRARSTASAGAVSRRPRVWRNGGGAHRVAP